MTRADRLWFFLQFFYALTLRPPGSLAQGSKRSFSPPYGNARPPHTPASLLAVLLWVPGYRRMFSPPGPRGYLHAVCPGLWPGGLNGRSHPCTATPGLLRPGPGLSLSCSGYRACTGTRSILALWPGARGENGRSHPRAIAHGLPLCSRVACPCPGPRSSCSGYQRPFSPHPRRAKAHVLASTKQRGDFVHTLGAQHVPTILRCSCARVRCLGRCRVHDQTCVRLPLPYCTWYTDCGGQRGQVPEMNGLRSETAHG